ncbi:Uma2 family endonuclease [Streptomyces sp. LB8]|uniref:Uma2 family endonuclease n=1 Tax=Streptomyces sp. LB8 TaxID=3042509 RepID=UPI0026481DA9|nr:Uma2 family endonuclease [Streptomyces sp. LB8]MDN5381791.1 Uma2 family endonuclease [Streptomyces sp. LB8]
MTSRRPWRRRGGRRRSCRPPRDGYTVDDLCTLPGLPPHTELIDGSLVFAGPQRYLHSTVIDLPATGLRRTVPGTMKIVREMTVVLDRRNGPEPDNCVVRAEAVTGGEQTHCAVAVADVRSAAEVVSPDAGARDHDTRPHKYAAAGIPHFWLAEMSGSDHHPVVRTCELDPLTQAYALTGIHRDRLKLDVPYDIGITTEALDAL